jgi:hypothetical protein
MAEIFGSVIGGLQLLEVAVKLKAFLGCIRDLPSRAASLAEDIETLALILQSSERSVSDARILDNELSCLALSKSIDLCRNAVASLEHLVQILSLKFSRQGGIKKSVLSAKKYFKGRELDRVVDRLERTFSLLKLAQGCFMQAQLMTQQSYIMRYI